MIIHEAALSKNISVAAKQPLISYTSVYPVIFPQCLYSLLQGMIAPSLPITFSCNVPPLLSK